MPNWSRPAAAARPPAAPAALAPPPDLQGCPPPNAALEQQQEGGHILHHLLPLLLLYRLLPGPCSVVWRQERLHVVRPKYLHLAHLSETTIYVRVNIEYTKTSHQMIISMFHESGFGFGVNYGSG